jgi:hypothetical protein
MFDSSIIQQSSVSDAHVAHHISGYRLGAPLGALCLPHPDQLLGFVDTNIYGVLYSVLRNYTKLSGAFAKCWRKLETASSTEALLEPQVEIS